MSRRVDRRSAPSAGSGTPIPHADGGYRSALYKRGPHLYGKCVRRVLRGEGYRDFCADVGDRINEVRVSFEVPVAELAAACGVHVSMAHRWEHGERLTLQRLLQIATALGVQPGDLMPTTT